MIFSDATGRLIGPADHGSVQVSIAHLDANGVATGKVSTFAISGEVRTAGRSDAALTKLAREVSLI
eukprot:gnl/Chilomastix_caulleri/3793.p1 GENE.gnl/Chilomastix_caulleri/3793~~gnl/Chilomastix_caulleri/3793.p1  ORF type:complete len:66 (+),score=16.81 gnl/Chilomastix_caulleri/3793:94-291(+)